MGRCLDGMTLSQKTGLKGKKLSWQKQLIIFHKGNQMKNETSIQNKPVIEEVERLGLYKTILSRRDVRGQFLDRPISDTVLGRILLAAHHAPSVGFMQPWDFIIVRDKTVRQKIHDGFMVAHEEAANQFDEEKSNIYRSLKLEGILESPLNICVTCDRERNGPVVIGRTAIPEMDLYSSVCGVQNLWLAARSENIGVGWVSIIHQEILQKALDIPSTIIPVAYLCLGYVSHFFKKPELETVGWLERQPLNKLIRFNTYSNRRDPGEKSLFSAIEQEKRNLYAMMNG